MLEEITQLIHEARPLVRNLKSEEDGNSPATVAAALRTRAGQIHTGVCGIGFCAEHAAVTEMLKHGQTSIEMVVAVTPNEIHLPCGRCRELMLLIDPENRSTLIVVSDSEALPLSQPLPNGCMGAE